MKAIDVHDLPEDMARAVAETVETLRTQVKKRRDRQEAAEQIRWPLGAKGDLRREDIYDHLDQ
jgi:hypothetical protein